jgi:hypothetical protein
MRSTQFQPEDKRMTESNSRLNFRGSARHIGTLLIAGFLIVVGIVVQLAQFGYDGLAEKNFWFISMIAGDIWNFLAVRSNLPALGELLRFWPMLFVAIGLALLAIPYSACGAKLCVAQARNSDRD